ncbi:MAG: polysaccharide biosynthesis protein [Betaproteobacteria bacterium]|nr:polysaccharide biosynthesis protein [Betaproteobacteria bacterium]
MGDRAAGILAIGRSGNRRSRVWRARARRDARVAPIEQEKPLKVNQAPLDYRRVLAFVHDVAASALVWALAIWLRFNLEIPPGGFRSGVVTAMLVSAPVHAAIFLRLRLYRGTWRYASIPDLQRIALAVLLGALATPTALVIFRLDGPVPRSAFFLAPVLLLMTMGGSRIVYRAIKERVLYGSVRLSGEPVLVIGAGDTAFNLLKEISRGSEWRAVGILDDDPGWQGRVLSGVRVVGNVGNLPQLALRFGLRSVIIALPAAAASVRRRAAELAGAAGLSVLTVPSFDDMLSGKVQISQLRKIELEDLLGREQVVLDDEGLHQFLTGKVVMVTGAGGSIGSELCRQIARYRPKQLLFFELNELALYSLEQEFAAQRPDTPIVCLIGDVRNRERTDATLARYRPSVVFHAAAYKHVPLMETDNAWEAVQNNVLGTLALARACARHGVEKFVLVSTDKAVNPANVMGATKRLAEQVCLALQVADHTRFITVRFGNVLGSAGSVIPKFREQIARGGPVTVTHPQIERYFMSIPEAAQLVLQAALMGKGGEIFVLEMGEPVKIVDLARDMIRLSGLAEQDIKIEFIGLRPGEKLFEELLADGEHTLPTPHPKLRIARAAPGLSKEGLEELLRWIEGPEPDADLNRALARFVPEYRPAEHPLEPAAAPAQRAARR